MAKRPDHLMETVNLTLCHSVHKPVYSSLGDGWVIARALLPRPTNGNSESATEAEVGEARWSRGGCRQLAASGVIWGQFLLAVGIRGGTILLTLLGGRQK